MNNKKIKVGKSTCLHLMRKVFVYCIKKNILEILIKNTNLFNKKAVTELNLYLKKILKIFPHSTCLKISLLIKIQGQNSNEQLMTTRQHLSDVKNRHVAFYLTKLIVSR